MNKLNKRLLYLVGILFLILSIASCKKEEAPKAATTATPTDAFQFIRISTDANTPIDSVVYVNKTTNARQLISNVTPTPTSCGGSGSFEQNTDLILTSDYLESDGCLITIYFNPSPDYKIFQGFMLRTGEDECVGYTPAGGLRSTWFNEFTIDITN